MPIQISSLLSSRLLKSKDSWAPAFYYFLQITLLTALVFACPYFIDFQNHLHFILFWTVTVTTFVLYFVTHRMDPGYIPHDAVFFTDQNETSQKPSPVAWKKFESIGSLRGPFSLPSTTDLASSILKSDRLGQKNSIVDIKKLSSAENGGTLANIVSLVSQPIQEVQENVDEKHEDTADHTFKLVIKELEANLSVEHDSRVIQTVAECEASLEENDDTTRHKIESLKHLDSKVKSSKDNVSSMDIERKSGDKLKPKNSGRNKSLLELPNQDKKSFIEIFHSVPTMHGDEDNKTKCEEIIGKYTNNEEDCKTGINILDRISSGNLSPQGRNSMEEDSVKFCTLSRDVSSPRVEHHQLISAKDSHRDHIVIKPVPVQYQSRIFSNEDDQNVQGNKDTYRIGISSFDDDVTLSARKKKDQIGLLDWSTSFRSPIIRKGIENMEASHIKEPGDGEALYVERRYCNICSLDQPFRSKHCRDCNRCVAQYDHHCPWLGTCVGEKNHLVFYFFLIFQVIEIAWADVKLFGQIIDSESWLSFSLILVVPLTLILIMVSALWIFHTYLASINLTTWESLSWEKISYLKDWRSEWGSPFSKGLLKNLKFFCCESKSQLQKWRLPKYKKTGK